MRHLKQKMFIENDLANKRPIFELKSPQEEEERLQNKPQSRSRFSQ
jgi:predicted DNA-binding protein (MmcQ/YjbR family)